MELLVFLILAYIRMYRSDFIHSSSTQIMQAAKTQIKPITTDVSYKPKPIKYQHTPCVQV